MLCPRTCSACCETRRCSLNQFLSKPIPQFLVIVAAVAFGAFLERSHSTAQAETPKLEVSGSCSSGELLVYGSSNRARCVELDELRVDSCGSGEFLTARSGQIRCIGPSSTSWGAEGLLPRCQRDEIVVSEGFGKWKCAQNKK